MRPAFKSLAHTFAATATEIALQRIIPALAVGLIAFAHELCPESARAEAKRRAG